MTCAFQEDVIADLRERIIIAIQNIISKDKGVKIIDEEKNLLKMIKGIRDFMILDSIKKDWITAKEYDRLIKFEDDITEN